MQEEGKNPINLMVGNPKDKPDAVLADGLRNLLEEEQKTSTNLHGYMVNKGYPQVRHTVAEYMNERTTIPFDADDIFMTAGCASAINISLAFLLNPGDEIIILSPGFLEYSAYIKQNGGKPVFVNLDDNFKPDYDALEKALSGNTRGIIVNFPNNPTGAVLEDNEVREFSSWLEQINKKQKRPIVIIEDSPYDQICFGPQHMAMISAYKHTLFITSFSKSHGIAGERIGYIAVHPEFTDANEKDYLLKTISFQLRRQIVNAPAMMQRLILQIGCRAISDISSYHERIRKIEAALLAEGFKFIPAKGAFYVFACLPDYVKSLESWEEVSLSGNEPLLAVPGVYFGGEKYNRYIRFSVTAGDEVINRAVKRIHELSEIYRKKHDIRKVQ